MKKPQYLLKENLTIDAVIDNIIKNPYFPLDKEVPTCRFRGTIIEPFDHKKGILRIIAWQRNVAAVRKMEVSLPTVIVLELDEKLTIKSIELNSSFKGSKGLMCSRNYLDNRLKDELLNKTFDSGILSHIKLNKLFCYHLVEVLAGAYSYLHQLLGCDKKISEVCKRFCEEEVMDVVVEGNDIHYYGRHIFENQREYNFILTFHDIINRIAFKPDGSLSRLDNIRFDFTLDDRLMFSESVNILPSDLTYGNLQKILLKCTAILKKKNFTNKRMKFLNTNLYPMAFVGLLVQGFALRIFRNNYNYISHALTGLQRYKGIPQCVGSVKNIDEAVRFFPGFDPANLI